MIKYIKEESNTEAFIHHYTITHWNYINSKEIMLVTHVCLHTLGTQMDLIIPLLAQFIKTE